MKVFFTRDIPDNAYTMLKDAGYEVVVNDAGVLSPEELHRLVLQAAPHALVSTVDDRIDGAVLDAAGAQLRIVANYAVGYNNIDCVECARRGIVVTNTPDVLTEAVAEHTVALMFALARRVVEADTFTRAGKFTSWQPLGFLGTELSGKMLGVLGAGRIGSRVASLCAKGVGMRVCYYDVQRNPLFERETGAFFCATPEMVIRQSDVLSVHVPFLPSTEHLLSRERIGYMKRTAFVVNTSRGQVIDEGALADAVNDARIAGAALDVFEHEPHIPDALLQSPRVILTPHIASATHEAREGMAEIVAKNVLAVCAGRPALNAVQGSVR